MVEPIEQGHRIKIQNGWLNQPERETALDCTWILIGFEDVVAMFSAPAGYNVQEESLPLKG